MPRRHEPRPIRSFQIIVRLTEEEGHRLTAICAWQDVSLSQASRKAVRHCLDDWERARRENPRAVIL